MTKSLEDFTHFIDGSPTVFHASKEVVLRLKKASFTPLAEGDKWSLSPSKGYYVTRDDSLVAAFRTPKKTVKKASILSSHIDSPCLKIRPHPTTGFCEIGQILTEVYGSPLLHTWLDRDLVIGGKLSTLDHKGKREDHLVLLKHSPVIIPGIAYHLDRSIGEKGLLVQKQEQLKPLFSLHFKHDSFEKHLQKYSGFDTLLSFDLFLASAEKPTFLGFEQDFLAAPRLDNLSSAYAALFALTESKASQESLQMAFFWNHEEIGSETYTGANSTFASELLERICLSQDLGKEDYFRLKSRSINLSIDVAHGFHPNFPDKYDLPNAPMLGKGPVLKFNAGQKYATGSDLAASLIQIADKAKIPLQKYACRSDIPSGSTVGSMMAANLGIQTLDLGIGCFAMHSLRETISPKDQILLGKLLLSVLEI